MRRVVWLCAQMPIIDTASVQDLKRLLELFPIVTLRETWSDYKGTKEEIGFAAGERRELDRIINFVDSNFGCCKQHVYVFAPPEDIKQLPAGLASGDLARDAGDHALYVLRLQYSVVLKDPLEETTLDFLWPVRIDVIDDYWVVRFVVLEKNLTSYFERPYYLGGRTVEEKGIVQWLAGEYGLASVDLHKGVKALWAEDFMDSHKAEYKKARSTARDVMDEELGIKEHDPDLYEILLESPLFNAMFQLSPDRGHNVSVVSIDPSRGYIGFPRYSVSPGDTDFVVHEILRRNR
jgi:hypothetical protein